MMDRTDLILVGLAVLCVFTMQSSETDPATDLSGIARAVPARVAALQAEAYTDVGKAIRSDELVGELAIANELRARNKAAIDTAYRPLDEAIEEQLGGGRFTDESAAAVFDQIASGLRRAAE